MKNFIRGMGFGIVLATIVLALTYMVVGDNISDEEIKRRAAKLGMVEEDSSIFGTGNKKEDADAQKKTEQNNTNEQDTTQSNAQSNVQSNTQSNTQSNADQDKSNKQDDTQSNTQSDMQSDAERDSSDEANNNQNDADSNRDTNRDTVKVKIVKGEDGISISHKLAKAGVVDDAAKFNKYLSKNYLQMDIMYGTYELDKNMSYEDVAKTIVVK